MMKLQAQQLITWLNLVPIAAMSLFWISPTFQFWLAVAGPLLPFGITPPPQPSWMSFLFWFGVSLLPLLLPAAYYQSQAFERRGTFYKALGVTLFRRVATNGDLINDLIRQRFPAYRVVSGPAALAAYRNETCNGEKWHLVFLLMGALTAIYAARIGWSSTALFLTMSNIVFNLYPVLLQRYTRARIAKIIEHHLMVHKRIT